MGGGGNAWSLVAWWLWQLDARRMWGDWSSCVPCSRQRDYYVAPQSTQQSSGRSEGGTILVPFSRERYLFQPRPCVVCSEQGGIFPD